MLEIENVLDAATLARIQRELATAPWADGRVTAGYQSALAKHNLQLPENSDVARRLAAEILAALGRNLLFQSAALPAAIFPPLFNRYESGHDFGTHVDNAIRVFPDGSRRIRTDLSATLFLAEPDSYDGGELIIDDAIGERHVKLKAGNMILYPATTLHRVAPVTRGARVASFFWIQSLVAADAQRAILFDMDLAIQSLRAKTGDSDPALITLTGCYHNLLRLWADL